MSVVKEEAKHLDSVTDHVQEQEFDASKASAAMTALGPNNNEETTASTTTAPKKKIVIKKDDVALLVSEFEVTEDVAQRVLREVALSDDRDFDGDDGSMVREALRRMIVS